MKNYKKIHILDFPPTLTFVRLNDKFKSGLFDEATSILGSQQKLLDMVNKLSLKYDIKRKYSRFNLYSWVKGEKLDKGKIKRINVPLWLLIELSKIISNSKNEDNRTMSDIEKNTKYYTGWGKSNPILKPKLPLYLTPEMISIIFHFVGDGHIGRKEVCSSYRQMNKEGLTNFLLKLNNIFGDF